MDITERKITKIAREAEKLVLLDGYSLMYRACARRASARRRSI